MDSPDENPSEDALTIDVLASCDCCCFTSVPSEEFLKGFTENLPEVGNRILLRIHGSTVPGILFRRCGNEQ
jgi:hypothetical protein